MLRSLLIALLVMCVGGLADGQEPPKKERELIGAQLPELLKDQPERLLMFTAGFCLATIVLGVAAIWAVAYLTWNRHLGETSCVRLIALIFLTTMAAFLIAAGFGQAQIGTVMTLLGTLAGYIFARNSTPADPPSPSPPAPPAT